MILRNLSFLLTLGVKQGVGELWYWLCRPECLTVLQTWNSFSLTLSKLLFWLNQPVTSFILGPPLSFYSTSSPFLAPSFPFRLPPSPLIPHPPSLLLTVPLNLRKLLIEQPLANKYPSKEQQYDCWAVREILQAKDQYSRHSLIRSEIRIFPQGLENNNTLKCSSLTFPILPHISGLVENCRTNI